MTSDPKLTCYSCGSFAVDYPDIDESGQPRCEDCRELDGLGDLLGANGDDEFTEALLEAAAPHRSGGYTDVGALLREAGAAAERGDLDQARHIVRCAAQPKWENESECQAAYEKHMAEQRGVSA